jgi:hypothetical protein
MGRCCLPIKFPKLSKEQAARCVDNLFWFKDRPMTWESRKVLELQVLSHLLCSSFQEAGYIDYGQLGVGDTADRLGFTQVDAGQLGGARIVMAACGWAQSVVVSAEGRVWTFGWGMFGILGHNDEQDRLVPTLLAAEVFEGSKIVTVATGGFHNMARCRGY